MLVSKREIRSEGKKAFPIKRWGLPTFFGQCTRTKTGWKHWQIESAAYIIKVDEKIPQDENLWMRFVMKLKKFNNGNREGQSATLVGKVEERRLRRDQSPN